MRPREFDPSWVVIRGLAAVGLVEIVGTPVQLPGRPVGERPASGAERDDG
jgi:hypothetical protein